MITVMMDDQRVDVPEWVTSLESFREWVHAPDFPEKAKVWWLNGGVWADMSQEQLYTHGQVKAEVGAVLRQLARKMNLGRVYPDGAYVTNFAAGISGNPDLTFVSFESMKSGRVEIVEGKTHGHTELIGPVEMVLEVVSDSSIEKDYEILKTAYFDGGIDEYWLIDVRSGEVDFDILKRGAKGFTPVRKANSWIRSAVFGKSFQLLPIEDLVGKPDYRLEIK